MSLEQRSEEPEIGPQLGQSLEQLIGELKSVSAYVLARLRENRPAEPVIAVQDGACAVGYLTADGTTTLEPADGPGAASLSGAMRRAGFPETPVVVLQIPDRELLRRTVQFPAVNARTLARAIPYEVERLSPIPLAGLYYDFVRHGQEGSKTVVDIRLVRRETIDNAKAAASDAGAQTGAIVFEGDIREADWQRFPVDRMPYALLRLRRWQIPISLAASVLLLLGLLLATYIRGDAYIGRIEDARAGTQQQALLVDRDLKKTDQLGRQMAFLASQRRAPLVVALLSEISRLTPDGTWINNFDLSGSKVRIQGYSRRASDLIALIDRSKAFSNARFDAPVVQDTASGNEQFSLSFDVRQR